MDDVSFSLEEKEMMAIIGESGSGKSTLGRLLCQFAKPDSGQILFEGRDITHLPSRHQKELYRKLQMVFQNPIRSFHPRFTLGKASRQACAIITSSLAGKKRSSYCGKSICRRIISTAIPIRSAAGNASAPQYSGHCACVRNC